MSCARFAHGVALLLLSHPFFFALALTREATRCQFEWLFVQLTDYQPLFGIKGFRLTRPDARRVNGAQDAGSVWWQWGDAGTAAGERHIAAQDLHQQRGQAQI